MFKERGSIVVFVVLSSTSFALKGLICSILTPSLGIRLRYSNLNKCITKLNDDDGILLEWNAYWNPMEEYLNDIIYLDLCTHPFMSMFQMSGSGDDPLTLTPTGSRNPQGSSSTRPLGLPLTPQQHLQLSSPGISVRAYGTPSPLRISSPTSTMTVRPPGGVTQPRLIPLPSGTQIRILRSATSQTPMRSPILTTSITPSTVSTAMPRNLTPKKGRITRSAVHEEFNEVIVFNRRLKKNVNGRKCKHCDSEFSGKNKTNLEDHLRVFHKEEYQKALGKILNCC